MDLTEVSRHALQIQQNLKEQELQNCPPPFINDPEERGGVVLYSEPWHSKKTKNKIKSSAPEGAGQCF